MVPLPPYEPPAGVPDAPETPDTDLAPASASSATESAGAASVTSRLQVLAKAPRCRGAAITKYRVGVTAADDIARPGRSVDTPPRKVSGLVVAIEDAASVTLPHSGGGTTGASGSDVNIAVPMEALAAFAGRVVHVALAGCNTAGWSAWSAASAPVALEGESAWPPGASFALDVTFHCAVSVT